MNQSITHTTISQLYLTEEQRLMIYRLFAEFRRPSKVITILKETHGIDVTASMVRDMCRDVSAIPYIQRFRDEFLVRVKEVPVANKRVRVDALQTVLDELMEYMDGKVGPDGNGLDMNELLMIHRRINETLAQAREEIEGKPTIMQQFNVTQFSNLSDDELQRRKEEIIAKAITTKAS